MEVFGAFLFVVIIFVIIIISNAIRILREYERGVIFRLGRIIAVKGPGIIFLIPAGFSLAVNVVLIGFELLVATLQAYVFAVLTCIYLHDAVHLH